ncbi:MAG: ferrous iron transport protein A [Clostridia bacterium]|nr:ferrous iron transport protein A [Clostridia bacterium]
MGNIPSLCEMRPGETAFIEQLLSHGSIRRRFLDLGLVKNTPVKCLGRSPSGDPSAFLVRGTVIAIRNEDSRNILIHI